MAEEADLSSTSFVSSISLASSIYQPKPPDGPKPSSQRFSRSSKVAGKVVRSPYLTTSTPCAVKKPRLNPSSSQRRPSHRVGHSRHGNRAVPVVWMSPPEGQRANFPRPSVSNFLHSLMKTPAFSAAMLTPSGARKRQNSCQYGPGESSYVTTPYPPSGAGSAKVSGDLDAIELRDMLVELQKEMNVMRKERDVAKAQQVRLSKELLKKDKDIEDLMSKGHIRTRDANRSLTKTSSQDKSSVHGGGVALVSSLRQQVHGLERALREKEGEVARLQRGVAASRVREAEVQAETYYREICRLKQLVAGVEGSDGAGPPSLHEARLKLQAVQETSRAMATQIETLQQENKTLRHKTELYDSLAPSPSPNIVGQHGAITDRYQDYNRAQMLSALVQLEMHCRELERSADSACEDKEKARVLYEKKISELRTQADQAHTSTLSLQEQLTSCHGSEEKLRSVIQRLKDDRLHYRKAAEHTQSELQAMEERLSREEVSREELVKELQVVRQDYQNEMTAIQHSRKLAQRQSSLLTAGKAQRETAASTIQTSWRKRQARAKQERYQREAEEAIVNLQSALKAHLARKKAVSSVALPPTSRPASPPLFTPALPESGDSSGRPEDHEGVWNEEESTSSDAAIELVQSALRGYLTRQMALQDLKKNEEGSPVMNSGVDQADVGGYGQPAAVVGRVSSPLVSYTPPSPHTPKQGTLDKSLHLRRQASGKQRAVHNSPWPPLADPVNSGSDEDYQHVPPRTYLSTSSESPQDPDKCLLMDEL